ncbi:M1 family metallopeptidase [Methanoculleus sp. FWC-SCC1]|uniref:M1 family metallopeptidase n=1 Tax=Methanoculleus frigidifontis TaxID=2584085 RepID=A0ABT8MAM3_9EURY|nr:M1 family metallopeptidase [Methanoculleus sp. FWC-SCC1]MDN7024986.1 M1 family metallopeptidase [Methanoculleus sp. FWC-SCC1]
MTDALYKYRPADFGALPVAVIHMDLTFDVYDGHTRVVSHLTAETLDIPLSVLDLNARDLDVLHVTCDEYGIASTYDRDAAVLSITFASPVPPRTRFTLKTETICRPSHHILEGLYYDATPPGAPPTQITQCQQWGFQRLVPCLDDMTAKCTYRTTIVADCGYSHLITNGDVAGDRIYVGLNRSSIRYLNTRTPMAPYLFFLGVGTYETFRREVEYPGGSTFMLELLVPPGSDPAAAGQALEVLADAVIWVHLFTGPEQYRNGESRREIYRLIRERDRLKEAGGDPAALERCRVALVNLTSTIVTGYAYTGSVYREIGMQNSDFGGMENVGNTTITTNRIMPFPAMTDTAFDYMIRVKVHEYYHNLNGSEVTGESPFEIWLNEAATVYVEEQYHAFLFGEAYTRLATVLGLLAPEGGTLVLDRGAGSMPIEPDGFNDPNELITGVTYSKAPEFVRMIETLVGKETFVQALALYHTRYRHANASRADWIRCMEEVSGLDLAGMAEVWLKETGYPTVTAAPSYDPAVRRFTLALHQSRSPTGRLWEFPFRFAIVRPDGSMIAERTVRIFKEDTVVVLDDVDAPAYLSLNRGYSFYGRVEDTATVPELLLQARTETDIVNRFIAFARLADRETIGLVDDPGAAPDPAFPRLFLDLLTDTTLMDEAGGQLLTIFASVSDERYAYRYRALAFARRRLYVAIAGEHEDALYATYHRAAASVPETPDDLSGEVTAIKHRQVKNTALAVLAALDTPAVHALLRDQFSVATSATDRIAAFRLYLESTAPDRMEIFTEFLAESRQNLVAWETFLGTVAASDAADIVSLLRQIEASDAFRIEQANEQRALYARFALNRKHSLETEAGRAFLTDALLRLAPINEYSTVRALDAFAFIDRMEERYHAPVVRILAVLLATLDPAKTPSVYNTGRRLLLGAPSAVQAYEKEYGRIPALAGDPD